MMRGIRGAACVEEDTREQILKTSLNLFETIMKNNEIRPEQVSAVFMTVTPDIRSAFPAEGIRCQEVFRLIPVLCSQEIPVPGALEKCLRILVLADQPEKSLEDIHHVYLGRARELRKDLENTP